MDALLTPEQLAKILGLRPDMVKRMTRRDQWPHVAFSPKTIRYRAEHVESIVEMYDRGEYQPRKGLTGQTPRSIGYWAG